MSALRTLAACWSCLSFSARADGPQTTGVETTTRDPSSQPACGCTTTSFILARAESTDARVVRQTDSSFQGPILAMTSEVSQEACEATLLRTSAVAYSYNVLTQSCELFTKISESVAAPSVHSGATMPEFPWQCHLACIAYGDPRWTGVVRTYIPPEKPSCQCCFNEDSSFSKDDALHYFCTASGCQNCDGKVFSSKTKKGCRLAMTAFLFTSLGLSNLL